MGYIQEAEHSATLASQRFGKIRTTIRYPHERVARNREEVGKCIRLHVVKILDDRKKQKKRLVQQILPFVS